MKKNGKYCSGKKGFNMKPLAVLLALTLLVGCAIGGTIAWLTDKSEDVVNTFSTSDINITLTETQSDFKMVPGHTIAKDPKATVKAGSEDCYLFVEIQESDNFDSFMTYAIADGWTVEDPTLPANVIYRRVDDIDADKEFAVLKDNQVAVKDTVTKDMMNALTDATRPTLTFTAYAVQQYNSNHSQFTAKAAWDAIHTPTAAPGFGTP